MSFATAMSTRCGFTAARTFSSSSRRLETPPSNTVENMRSMLQNLAKKRAEVEDDRRRPFRISQIISPMELRNDRLYADRPRTAKAPLLGPSQAAAKRTDPFHLTNTSPLDHVYNPKFISAFLDQTGQMKSRAQTGLTRKSQRQAFKLVKRARGMGTIGTVNGRPSPNGLGTERYGPSLHFAR